MKRDFTDESKVVFLNKIKQIENGTMPTFTHWTNDRWCDYTKWMDSLGLTSCIDNVNLYHSSVLQKNDNSYNKINNIFNTVKDIDITYAVKFSSNVTQIQQLNNIINNLSNVINPANGKFDVDNIQNSLKTVLDNYEESKIILEKLSEDGITQEDVNIDGEIAVNALNDVVSGVISLLPNLSIGQRIEVPIGLNLIVYYEVNGDIDNGSNINISTEIDNQKLLLKKYSFSNEYENGIKTAISTDGEKTLSNDNYSITISTKGVSVSGSFKIDNNTFTSKLNYSLIETSYENSVTTEYDNNSLTSTLGVSHSSDTNWVTVPQPVYVKSSDYDFDNLEMPSIQEIGELVGEAVVISAIVYGVYRLAKVVIAGVGIYLSGGTLAPALIPFALAP